MTRAARTLSLTGVVALLSCCAFSCSSGPEPIPRGGAQFTTGSTSAPPNRSCPTSGYTAAIGNPPPVPNSGNPGGTLADGENGTTVQCVSRGSGPVTFSGRLSGVKASDGQQAELRFTNGQINEDGTGTANVLINIPLHSTSLSNISLRSDSPCTVTGVETDGPQYGDGILWAHFECPAMIDNTSGYCRTEGVVVFEGCSR